MRKALLMAGLLVVCTASIVSAQSVDLNWNECSSGTLDVPARTIACTANTGLNNLVASFYPGPAVTNLENIEVIVDYQVDGGALPCWWNFTSGQPRVNSLIVLGVDPGDANGDPLFKCPGNYFKDGAALSVGGMAQTGVDRGRLGSAVAVPSGAGGVPAAGEQFGTGFRINNALTTTCTGCLQGAILVLNRVTVGQGGGLPTIELNNPQNNNCVSWRTTGLNCGATPTRNSTWGSVKALYR